MTLKIDLRAKVITEESVVWRLFPGENYKFYDVMRKYSQIFLQYYDAPFPINGKYEESDQLLQVIAKGEAQTNAAIRGDNEKISELSKEEKLVWSQARKLKKGWLEGLYCNAKIGDLVLLPGPGWRKVDDDKWEMQPTLVGEITGGTKRWANNGPESYLSAKLLTREVRWLSDVKDHELPDTTIRSLRTQNALVKLRADNLDRVISAAYKNVIVKNEILTQFVTTNPEFKSTESFHFQSFVMAIVAAYEKVIDDGILDQTKSIYDIASEISKFHELVPEQNANIHSPGYTTLKSATIIPLIVAALYALASDCVAQPFDDAGQAQVEVVASEDVMNCEPLADISADVRKTLNQIGYERWQQMCHSREAASADGGLESVAKIVH